MTCGTDSAPSGPGGTPLEALLVLPRTDTTPPPARTVAVRNDRLITVRLEHGDGARTLFAEFRFTPRSILAVNGQPLCDTCTVLLTIAPLPDQYGFTIQPASLVFSAVGSPVVTLSYGVYGDLSVHDASGRYPTTDAYSQALAIWYERDPGSWYEERNSGHMSATVVSSAVDAPVAHLLAAPK